MNLQKPYAEIISTSEMISLAVLYQEIANHTTPAFFNWTEASALIEIRSAKNFVIQEDNKIQAFVTFRTYADRLEIMALGTRPLLLKKGLGLRIFGVLKNYAKHHSLPIWLEVHEQNRAAIHLYLKSGFTVTRTRKGYYQDGGNALLMTYRES